MNRSVLLLVVVVLTLAGCVGKKEPTQFVPVQVVADPVDYSRDVKPILNKRCVVCHSCYNSPCQLKLSSFQGLDRGATKEKVYNATRLRTMDPTRLFVDAETTEDWRQRGFTSVTQSRDIAGGNDSFLLRFISHKADEHPESAQQLANPEYKDFFNAPVNSFSPEEDDLTCAATSIEVDEYLKKHPNRGMPYGFPPLSEREFKTIRDWLVLGAHGPSAEESDINSYIIPEDRTVVQEWEELLNGEVYARNPERDVKRMMTARYLFEHLFLAHISFDRMGERFYELVRSETPPGVPVKIIGTIRPYDDPGTAKVYYRFRRITSTIVHKTHMVFEFDESFKQRIKELFLDTPWLNEPVVLAQYHDPDDLNPFEVFRQIPPKSRYNFLLDNVHYIIMTFIRGPVCKGQIALNVVRDHFWLLFMDPDHDLTVTKPDFLPENFEHLEIPSDQSYWFRLLWRWYFMRHHSYVGKYVEARRLLYEDHYGARGPDLDAIWRGRTTVDGTPASAAPVLTVFRHFNSASVHQGTLGGLPRTIWVMDYPVVERIYYALVAGFNVYGNRGHQVATRLYMDGLRQESETYFLDFMPQETRYEMMKDWYGTMEPDSIDYKPLRIASGHSYSHGDPKRELVEEVVASIPSSFKVGFDQNYLPAGQEYPDFPDSFENVEDYIQGFLAVSEPGSRFFKQVKEHGANVAFIRIVVPGGEDEVVSMVVNRWHKDVRTMINEEEKLDSTKDQADFIRGYVSSYPNYFFVVNSSDLSDFLELLKDFDREDPCHVVRFLKYGINREQTDFWEHYDWFQADFLSKNPHTGGLFDLNRYYQMAVGRQGRQFYEEKCHAKKGL